MPLHTGIRDGCLSLEAVYLAWQQDGRLDELRVEDHTSCDGGPAGCRQRSAIRVYGVGQVFFRYEPPVVGRWEGVLQRSIVTPEPVRA